MLKYNISGLVVGLLLVLTGYNTYSLHEINASLEDKAIKLEENIKSIRMNTDGRLQDLAKQYNTLSQVKNTTVIQKEIQYVKKETPDDSDIDIRTGKPKVTVSVNGGRTYSFDTLTTESSKFEDGKLLVQSTSAYNIDITSDEFKRSKWSLTTAMNSDKKIMGGLNYELGHSVKAGVFVGQGIKPYYGLTWQIGNRTGNGGNK